MTELCAGAVVTEVFRGSDKTWAVRFKNTDDSPVNLTGYTPELFDVNTAVEARLTASIPIPADGTLYVVLEGSPPLPVGRYPFRARAVGPVDRASPSIVIVVK